jgi:hypothetical protein
MHSCNHISTVKNACTAYLVLTLKLRPGRHPVLFGSTDKSEARVSAKDGITLFSHYNIR